MDDYERLAAQEALDAENDVRPACPECDDGYTEVCPFCWERLGGGV